MVVGTARIRHLELVVTTEVMAVLVVAQQEHLEAQALRVAQARLDKETMEATPLHQEVELRMAAVEVAVLVLLVAMEVKPPQGLAVTDHRHQLLDHL